MEKFWHSSIYNYLKAEPEEHVFMLTEPPMNPPENRERMAETFFETFNAKGLYIGVQAVLAMISSGYSETGALNLTGTVVDSGDGVTHIIPVVIPLLRKSDGYVIGSCIKNIPLAGHDMTKFLMQCLKERKEPIPGDEIMNVAREIKEKYCYLADDMAKEFPKYDSAADGTKSKKIKTYKGKNSYNGETFTCDVGYERFLAPEMFFHPEIVDSKWKKSLPYYIDNSVQNCPIDTRRGLYSNIVLSGGSTLYPGLGDRLEKEVKEIVDNRLARYKAKTGFESKKIDVKVSFNPYQKYSVWQGGSILASWDSFEKVYKTKAEYDEYGPSIARHNPVFSGGM